MANRFVTIFPITENSHLIKDLGQIPHFMNKLFGYQSEIVSYQNDPDYFHTKGEVDGVDMKFISNIGKKHFWEKGVEKFINEEANDIDVLNLYHFKKDTMKYGVLYKKINPAGKLFVKMDAYNEHLKSRIRHTVKPIKQIYFKRLEKEFLKAVDIISIENQAGFDLVASNYPELKKKLIYLPNGINDRFLTENFSSTKSFDEKEDAILTVGRIGLEVKNNEMLLRVIPMLDLKSWKVQFVGPIHTPFNEKIDQFYKEHPQLKDKVEFVGEINDRKQLYEYYNKSKVFCLTSPFESFGMAFVEAQYFGNYIMGTTGMSAFRDLSNNLEYGSWTTVNDDEVYVKELQRLIDNQEELQQKCEAIKQQTQQKFTWTSIVTQLYNSLNG